MDHHSANQPAIAQHRRPSQPGPSGPSGQSHEKTKMQPQLADPRNRGLNAATLTEKGGGEGAGPGNQPGRECYLFVY